MDPDEPIKPIFGSKPRSLDLNVRDDDRGPVLLGFCISLTLMASFAVFARIYVLLRMQRVAGWDDVFILLAMGTSVAALGVVWALGMNGGGRHSIYLQPEKKLLDSKLSFARQLLYMWAITIVKLSIALFLMRFSPHRYYRRFLKCTMAFLALTSLCATFAILLQCQPVRYVWDKSGKGTCYPAATLSTLWYTINGKISVSYLACYELWLTGLGVSISTDLVFSVLALPMLWNVRIKKRVKLVIVAIMALGIFAAAAGSVKVWYISQSRSIGDEVYEGTLVTIWACAECNLGIIAASIPCLKPLFRRYFGKDGPDISLQSGRSNRRSHRRSSGVNWTGWHMRCSHDHTLVSHSYRTGDITPRKEVPVFGKSISKNSRAEENPYYQQDLARLVNDVERDDARVLYANMSRALAPVYLGNESRSPTWMPTDSSYTLRSDQGQMERGMETQFSVRSKQYLPLNEYSSATG